MITLFDSHAHLDFRDFERDREEVIARAHDAGVKYIVTVGSGDGLKSMDRALAIAEAHDNVWATVGVHPHDAKLMNDDVLLRMRELARRDKVVAIGEIGLDFAKMHSPRPVQLKWYRAQLALARELELPVVIHDREAHGEIMSGLNDVGVSAAGGIMHCYSGSADMVRELVKKNFYISFSGTVTYPNAKNLHRAGVVTPPDRILLETDCPFLAPQPHRGQRNEPAYVKDTAAALAGLRRVPLEQLAADATRNTFTAFNITI